MAALGRILQVVGWLWLALGFFGPIVNLPNVSIFPGILLIFIARVLRTRARRREIPTTEDEFEEEEPASRMLNTERERQPDPVPDPPAPSTISDPSLSRSEPVKDEHQSELLEQILLAGRGAAEEQSGSHLAGSVTDDEDTRHPLSSAEMIARAHRRWDSKPIERDS